MSFAERLIEAFEGASMAEIARRLNVPHSTIRNYVQQNRLPSAEILLEIANNTNVSLHWLLTGEGDKSTDSAKLGNLEGLLDDGDMAVLERMRQSWQERQGFNVSWDDFLRTLITWGEVGIRNKQFEEKFDADFESLEFISNRKSILTRSIVEIIRQELISGNLRDTVAGIVREEMASDESSEPQDLGTVDEFDVDEAVRRHDNPMEVVLMWYQHDRQQVPQISGGAFFSGWNKKSHEEKVEAVKLFKKNIDEDLYFEKLRLAPKNTKHS